MLGGVVPTGLDMDVDLVEVEAFLIEPSLLGVSEMRDLFCATSLIVEDVELFGASRFLETKSDMLDCFMLASFLLREFRVLLPGENAAASSASFRFAIFFITKC